MGALRRFIAERAGDGDETAVDLDELIELTMDGKID